MTAVQMLNTSLLVAVACGGAAGPRIASEAPAPTPTSAPQGTTTGAAEPAAVNVKVAQVQQLARAAASEQEQQKLCSGTDLDLGSLAAQGVCDVETTAAPLPEGLSARLEPEALDVISGTETTIRIMLTNTTAAAMRLELDASCAFLNVIEPAVFDRNGQRVDRISAYCDVDAKPDCAGHVVGVVLEPGGDAYVRLTILARVAVLGKKCIEYAGRALSPGTYRLELRTPFQPSALTATLNVGRVERLARKRCGSYARRVASVAEPDASRRRSVATKLAAQCRRQPPAKVLANCQLAAKTAEQLAACTGH